MSLVFSDLSKNFGKTNVLNSLDLTINDQDRVALIGSNGAGKTTLIRCLLGQYIHKGTVKVNGMRPREHRRKVLQKISFVPQLPPPLKMPVGELIRFSAGICEAKQAKMLETIDRLHVDFEVLKNRPFVKLSGGQKQKILISIAMGRDVDVMILDEPTANLDPKSRAVFFDLMSERLDRTMIISSHRLEEVAALVNRVVELDQGRLVLDDRVMDNADPASRLFCKICLSSSTPAMTKVAQEWNLKSDDVGLNWQGQIAAADRLQFLGVLARYSGVLKEVHLQEKVSKAEKLS